METVTFCCNIQSISSPESGVSDKKLWVSVIDMWFCHGLRMLIKFGGNFMEDFITHWVEATTLYLGVGRVSFFGCSVKSLNYSIKFVFVLKG